MENSSLWELWFWLRSVWHMYMDTCVSVVAWRFTLNIIPPSPHPLMAVKCTLWAPGMWLISSVALAHGGPARSQLPVCIIPDSNLSRTIHSPPAHLGEGHYPKAIHRQWSMQEETLLLLCPALSPDWLQSVGNSSKAQTHSISLSLGGINIGQSS